MRWPWQKPDAPAHLRTGEWGNRWRNDSWPASGSRSSGAASASARGRNSTSWAWHGRVLVFVEVKTRASEEFGRGWTSVNRAKQRQLSRAAWSYLRALKGETRIFSLRCRRSRRPTRRPSTQVRHLENAFQLSPEIRLPW
jgi:Holliday junction resolvase-like predicted endonuclease